MLNAHTSMMSAAVGDEIDAQLTDVMISAIE